MAIVLNIIDEDGEVQSCIGLIEEEGLRSLAKIAREKDLKCLPFIGYGGDTIFNAKQSRQIRKEIEILRNSRLIDEKILNLIEKGAEEVRMENLLFMKFEGG
jgi:hypothetical protein